MLKTDLNTTKTYLEDADIELQKSLTAQNSTLTTRVSGNIFTWYLCILFFLVHKGDTQISHQLVTTGPRSHHLKTPLALF